MTDDELNSIFNGIEVATEEQGYTSDTDKEIAELQNQLQAFEETISLAKQEVELVNFEALDAKEKEIQEIRKTAEERMATIRLSIAEDKEKAYEARKKLRSEQEAAEQIRRKIEQAERVKLAEQRFLSLSKKWDEFVVNTNWFSLAMEHQFEAAKRMATQRKLILADTMGLGKTLSVIAAIDLIEVATNEATKENPVDY